MDALCGHSTGRGALERLCDQGDGVSEMTRELNIGLYTAGSHFGIESLFLGVRQPATLTCNNICDIQSISKQVRQTIFRLYRLREVWWS